MGQASYLASAFDGNNKKGRGRKFGFFPGKKALFLQEMMRKQAGEVPIAAFYYCISIMRWYENHVENLRRIK